jgi:hypothetical protein
MAGFCDDDESLGSVRGNTTVTGSQSVRTAETETGGGLCAVNWKLREGKRHGLWE